MFEPVNVDRQHDERSAATTLAHELFEATAVRERCQRVCEGGPLELLVGQRVGERQLHDPDDRDTARELLFANWAVASRHREHAVQLTADDHRHPGAARHPLLLGEPAHRRPELLRIKRA